MYKIKNPKIAEREKHLWICLTNWFWSTAQQSMDKMNYIAFAIGEKGKQEYHEERKRLSERIINSIVDKIISSEMRKREWIFIGILLV